MINDYLLNFPPLEYNLIVKILFIIPITNINKCKL